jgi:hypothetical protein
MTLESLSRGTNAPGRAKINFRTLRTDKWWIQPAVTVFFLASFVVYATWRAFEGAYYYAKPLLSPFYSPCLATSCVPGASDFGQPFGSWWVLSPALIILIFPLGFRMTCYYYRKTYYRAFWLSPPACAVAEPHKSYSGETRAPLILQNSHRYFFWAALVINVVLTFDAVIAFRDAQGEWGHMSVGTLILINNAFWLWLYTLSCHSCRHILGGKLKHFSKNPVRYKAWTWVSKLNEHHPKYAWISLFGVWGADVYIRLVATETITNFYFF